MTTKIKFGTRTVGLSIWAVLTALTLLLYSVFGTREFTDGGLLIAWLFFSWNFFAYAFDKRMWPWQLVELNDPRERKPGVRTFWFWLSVILYAALLATIAWSE